MDHEITEKRRHARYQFSYPVKIDLFQKTLTSVLFTGVLFNISIGGACVKFEDRYGRIDIDSIPGSRAKLIVSLPEGERIYLSAMIHWVRRESKRGFSMLMGIEFKEIEDWQLVQIEKFVNLRNKDQKMLWNLWENYVPGK